MKLPLLLVLFLIISCASKKESLTVSLVIKNVDIINVRDGSIREDQWIFIDSGKIIRILDQEIPYSEEAVLIDGTDKFLLPGLAEMHAHIPSESWGGNIDNTLFLYLSNGVTTIRGMLGHPIHLELREKAELNEILSPRIFTSSPSLNGTTVKTPEEADEKVRAYEEQGYDFLKLHPGIKRQVFDQIVKTAKEVGIKYAGHVSVGVGIHHALQNDYASVDHVDGFVEGLVPEQAAINPIDNGFFGYNFTNIADTSLIGELVKLSKEHHVWVVPTQSLFERWFSPEDPVINAAEPEMKYMPKETIDQWISSKRRIIENENYTQEQWEKFIEIRRQIILQLHRNGQGLLLGSDAPQVFNVPGFSIQHELDCMINAGLTPLEAIQTGTINPARYFDMEGEFGEIIKNASADLILLAKNPLEHIETLKEPLGVVVRGKWLDKETINARLQKIAIQ